MKSKTNVVPLKTVNPGGSRLDWLKWVAAFFLLLAGVLANQYYSELSMPLRLLGWLTVVVIAGFILSRTRKGRWVVGFFRDSRMELRKVIWPTREETIQTTLVVAVVVLILGMALWGIDGLLVWIIGWLTGQKG